MTTEIENRHDPYDIIAYADNNPKLQDTVLLGRPVVHPDKIESFDYDQIIVTTTDMDTVIHQLTDEYGIDPNVINSTMYYYSTSNSARIQALKNVSQLVYGNAIPGSVAELGVFQGDFSKQINAFFPDRTLYLFDTFEGFSGRDIKRDVEIGAKGVVRQRYDYLANTNTELVLSKMKYPEKCVIRKGYFPETAANLEDIFAFVSLDADLYQPMLEGLKYFYPRLSKGGFIFIHDFFADDWAGTFQAVSDYKKENSNLCYVPIGDDVSIAIVKP
ncbi:hypothetical protein FACS1894140_4190 [Spirochaetia bacterium]|nr:hypothetical protein FACS1894140_4190 [Spirochaetia bacterium]